jgi:hypothetical protein
VGYGTLSLEHFGELVVEIRSSIKAILTEADNYPIGTREKTPLAKTVRTCRQLLKVESGMSQILHQTQKLLVEVGCRVWGVGCSDGLNPCQTKVIEN